MASSWRVPRRIFHMPQRGLSHDRAAARHTTSAGICAHSSASGPGATIRAILLTAATALIAASAPSPTLAVDAAGTGRALSLGEAERIALQHQPTLAEVRGQSEAAEGRVEQARSGYLPQVTASAAYQRTTGNFAPRPGALPSTTGAAVGTWSSKTYNYFNFGAAASQLIYDFGQTSSRWRSAAANRDAALLNERAARAQGLLNVRRAYFDARSRQELVAVAEESVRNQERHVHQTEGFVRAGIRPDIDLARVRTDLANAQVQLVDARNNDALAVAALNQAMGLPAQTRYVLTDLSMPEIPGEGGASETLVEGAVHARPEIASLEEQKRAQGLAVGAVEGAYGPALAATAGGTDTGTHLDQLVPNWFVGLTVAWPILQGGLTRGQAREARGTLASLAAQAEVLRLQIRVDAEQAALAVAAAKANIVATREALTNARELLRLAERRYETGLGSAIELGDAQLASNMASAQEVGARYSLATARAQLLFALGDR
jgi:outer membrane protein